MNVPEIDLEDAKQAFDGGGATFMDIRDPKSHAQAHIPGAHHLTSKGDMDQLCADTAFDATVIVYCYHGNSSKGVTQYLLDQGFTNVQSLTGGFEAWRLSYDVETDG
ncbi:MAG: thiosulfate sulfurtransferase GlpE [Deltaproteobacteria bacterium]|nr:thiosulfate sulfurtransferase GlpE [Deltaproteobacteria bacterium]